MNHQELYYLKRLTENDHFIYLNNPNEEVLMNEEFDLNIQSERVKQESDRFRKVRRSIRKDPEQGFIVGN